MKAILIDFKTTSDSELRLISNKININYDWFIEMRDVNWVEKVIIDLDQMDVIACVYKHIEGVQVNSENFDKIKPFKVELPIIKNYDVDNILEKISEFGIDSITKEEKDFLDNFGN